jgi:transposase InsO family protein
LLGVTRQTIAQWLAGPTATPAGRGAKPAFTDVHLRWVCQAWKGYVAEREKVKISAFMKELRQQWKTQPWAVAPPSRKTVEDMLAANGCRKPTPRKSATAVHIEKTRRHFPGAQVLLDGKQVLVSLLGQVYTFVIEFCQDMATSTIGGTAIGDTETAELVKAAVADFTAQHGQPLATLQDNGAGNDKAAIDFGAAGIVVIKAQPYRPETKGLIEGEFGLFEKIVSTIEITGTTAQEMARSILKQLVAVYVRLRNQTPRCSVCPFTPQAMLNYQPTAAQQQQAYDQLQAASARQAKQQEQRLKVSQEFHALTDRIIQEYRLTGDRLRFKQSLKHVELAVIREAELQFAVQSARKGFDETKRTLAYFAAIVRNLQVNQDDAQRLATARRRYSLNQQAAQQRAEVQTRRAEQQQRAELAKQPEKALVIFLQAEFNLLPDFRKHSTLHKERLKGTLKHLLKHHKPAQLQRCLENTETAIMTLGQYPLKVRYEMINMVHDYLKNLTQSTG